MKLTQTDTNTFLFLFWLAGRLTCDNWCERYSSLYANLQPVTDVGQFLQHFCLTLTSINQCTHMTELWSKLPFCGFLGCTSLVKGWNHGGLFLILDWTHKYTILHGNPEFNNVCMCLCQICTDVPWSDPMFLDLVQTNILKCPACSCFDKASVCDLMVLATR